MINTDGGTPVLQPLNQLGTLSQDATLKWVSQRLSFNDEKFRQPKGFRPSCSAVYSSFTPQLHLVSLMKSDLQMKVKHIFVDPTKPTENTYTEYLTFPGS